MSLHGTYQYVTINTRSFHLSQINENSQIGLKEKLAHK